MAAANSAEDDLRRNDWSFREAEVLVLFMERWRLVAEVILGRKHFGGTKYFPLRRADLREPSEGCQ